MIRMVVIAVTLGVPSLAMGDGAKEGKSYEPPPAFLSYLREEFPKSVVTPAIHRTLQRLFKDQAALDEQVRDAVYAALSSQARLVREQLAEMVEALSAKNRATYDAASAKFLEITGDRKAYLTKAIGKLLPDVSGRARPLARVGVARNYVCDDRFIGLAMGLDKDPKAAAQKARKTIKAIERRRMCEFTRRWAEKRAVAEVDKFVEDLGRDLQGEKVELTRDAEETIALVRKALDRQMIRLVGGYREQMERIREGLQRIADEVAKPEPPKTPAPPAGG